MALDRNPHRENRSMKRLMNLRVDWLRSIQREQPVGKIHAFHLAVLDFLQGQT